jgi:hypothetical protein
LKIADIYFIETSCGEIILHLFYLFTPAFPNDRWLAGDLATVKIYEDLKNKQFNPTCTFGQEFFNSG